MFSGIRLGSASGLALALLGAGPTAMAGIGHDGVIDGGRCDGRDLVSAGGASAANTDRDAGRGFLPGGRLVYGGRQLPGHSGHPATAG
jgi:hypothetical protein